LGPTGVGKTETTKALAEMFFGAEAEILRLDMSEYNTDDSINRLIGSIGDESGRILGSMIRENSYGVLLLDEFEKTDKRVLDLFLQILDEGIFSDATGRKVSARNLIIIATSNAGSNLIFEIIKREGTLENRKDEIIEEVIRQGIYKPELLNRFDGVILFHPLDKKQLKEVSKLMLEKLALRLKEQGIILSINSALIDFLVAQGSDPKFGARALNRAVQDTVEKVIANKILSGEAENGTTLELTSSDLAR
jgi:ATP-dependent Clp protease ATP-binding subunit ClpA